MPSWHCQPMALKFSCSKQGARNCKVSIGNVNSWPFLDKLSMKKLPIYILKYIITLRVK